MWQELKGTNIRDPNELRPPLKEIPAAEAVGDTRIVYLALERALGVRLVNLVYRHLATVPGALEWAWSTVGPPFQNGIFTERSTALMRADDAVPTGSVRLGDFGLSNHDAGRVIETLDAYNRANPMNALSLRVVALALAARRPAIWTEPEPGEPGELRDLLPIAPLQKVPPVTMDILYRLAHLTTGDKHGLVPSLFRHFTRWPDLLAALADWLEPLAAEGVIEQRVSHVSALADEIARDIFGAMNSGDAGGVFPEGKTRKKLLQTIEVFPPAICRMIVIGGLLRTAIKS